MKEEIRVLLTSIGHSSKRDQLDFLESTIDSSHSDGVSAPIYAKFQSRRIQKWCDDDGWINH